jgi:ATP-dependent Clp protease ATP-binding subunit ClpA
MIRLDMSEYQQPDDVQRLLATGQTEASSLLLAIRQNPFSVVLLDEIEKAHPNVLNLLLQLLDEGQLTDASGRQASFKDSIIIATSNAGAQSIREHIASGEGIEKFRDELIDQLINSGQYKPELLNRFDDIVLFRPLNETELAQVVKLLLKEVNQTLAAQNITVTLTDEAIQKIVAEGNDPRLGARPMRRALQRAVEDTVAQKILRGEVNPGDTVTLSDSDLTSA